MPLVISVRLPMFGPRAGILKTLALFYHLIFDEGRDNNMPNEGQHKSVERRNTYYFRPLALFVLGACCTVYWYFFDGLVGMLIAGQFCITYAFVVGLKVFIEKQRGED